MTTALNELLAPIQDAYASSAEWQELNEQAYPSVEVKKVKKVKNKGSRHPGSTPGNATPQVEAQADGSVEGQDKAQVDLASTGTEALQGLNLNKQVS